MIRVFQFGKEAQNIRESIASRLNEPADNDSAGWISVTIELKEEFVASGIPKKVIDEAIKMAAQHVPFVKACASWSDNKVTVNARVVKDELQMFAGMIGAFKGMGVNQETVLEFRTSSSLNDIFAEDSPPLVNHLIKGISMKMQTLLWA